MVLAQDLSGDDSLDQTIFTAKDEGVINAAMELARMLKERHAYTDVANFSIKCTICNTGLKGEVEAQQHAQITGHFSFEEYS